MILTITPNPSLDLLYEAGRLVWDDANRIDAPRRRVGGQGINVVRAARALGGEARAVALLGGRTGDELERMLAREGAAYHRITIANETRTFVGVREVETGRSLLLNPRGPAISPKEAAALTEELCRIIQSERPKWVAVCGSVPPGLPADLYATLGAAAREAGSRFVPDCDGDALRNAASFAHVLVPNHHEAARLTGVEITDDGALKRALNALIEIGATTAAITLGARGAALANAQQAWIAEAPAQSAGSAVGAGDAFLAALLLGLDAANSLDQIAGDAVAAGSAVLLSTGAAILSAADAQSIREKTKVRPLD